MVLQVVHSYYVCTTLLGNEKRNKSRGNFKRTDCIKTLVFADDQFLNTVDNLPRALDGLHKSAKRDNLQTSINETESLAF